MSARECQPDALIMGAPKAGTSALHAALTQHPQIYASPVKEPKYYMCWDAPPPAYCGPGDAHSNQEWIWRREDYQALFHGVPEQSIRLESTPFYLYLRGARRRIAEELPGAKLIIIVRDPIDRVRSPRTTLGRPWNQAYAPRSWGERCAQALQPVPTSRRKFGGRPANHWPACCNAVDRPCDPGSPQSGVRRFSGIA
jgi:hypothetical protein